VKFELDSVEIILHTSNYSLAPSDLSNA